jgi:predicted acetyltransferase
MRRSRLKLVRPSIKRLPVYVDALQRGWSADNLRGAAAARQEMQRIAVDPRAYIESLDDREAKGDPAVLPDGSAVPRLPGYRRWLWDGEFCGVIGLRWQPGTTDLPPHCPGHIGYAVVPWKQRRGYATLALKRLLPEAKAEGLSFVEIATEPSNLASQRVIEANGGVLVARFVNPVALGATEGLRFRIALA